MLSFSWHIHFGSMEEVELTWWEEVPGAEAALYPLLWAQHLTFVLTVARSG